MLQNIIFVNLTNLEIQHFVNIGKDGRQNMMKIRLINYWNFGYGINIYQQNTKWEFGSIDKILLNALQTFKILELKNFETKKPRNQETRN